MFTIRKKVRFEMSHILDTSFSECCRQLHGHSYILEVFFESPTLNEDGMVLDFGLIKQYLDMVIKQFDHKMVVSSSHPEFKKFIALSRDVKGFVFVPYNPTAENMAHDIYHMLHMYTNKLTKVRLHETETGYAEYSE